MHASVCVRVCVCVCTVMMMEIRMKRVPIVKQMAARYLIQLLYR